MSPITEQVLQAALGLPDEERQELIDALLAVPPAGAAPIDERWMAEVRRRSAEFDAGKGTPIPWEQVRQRARRGDSPHG